MKRDLIILFVLVLAALVFVFFPQTESTTPASPSDNPATPLIPTNLPVQPTQAGSSPSLISNSLWQEQRNERFGFGIAVPCWWEVTPMPAQGVLSSMTIRSYDEAFFLANSEKGTWLGGIAPEGAISMDITAATGIDPNLTMSQAYLQLIDTNIYMVSNVIERSVGNNLFTIFVLNNMMNPSEPASLVYVTGLAPDAILIFSTTPTQAIHSSDAQAILSSYAGAKDEPVIFPKIQPSKQLINKACEL